MLAVHELTDEVPAVVQVAVPRGTPRPRIVYPPTEVSEFDVTTFDLGLQEREVALGERVRIDRAVRSVVDVMRMRLLVERRAGDPAELLGYARALDVEGPVRQAVEAVLS